MSYKYLFKFIVVGDASTGKTSYCLRLTNNVFSSEENNTVGVEFSTQIFGIDGIYIKCQFWDTAGCERFRAITRSYYRGVTAAIMVFDLSRRDTFVALLNWRKEIENNADADIPVLLVGTKSDKAIKVDQEEIKNFVSSNGYVYTEVSSKTGHNVAAEFTDFLSHLLSNRPDLSRWEVAEIEKPRPTEAYDCCQIH